MKVKENPKTTCKPCTYLPESAADYSQTSFWDTRQSSLLNGSHTPAKSSDSEPQKDGSQACQCGRGTLDCLIHPSTPDKWIAFMRGSLAKTLALLESKQVYLREPDQVFTAKSCASLAWFDQSSCSWKTFQQSFLTDSEPYSQTWPRWGMTQGGSAYAHPMSERRITEIDGFYYPTPTTRDHHAQGPSAQANGHMVQLSTLIQKIWPTPQTRDFRSGDSPDSPRAIRKAAQGWSANLNDAVKMWPTPSATDYKGSGVTGTLRDRLDYAAERGATKSKEYQPNTTGGQLNPNWVGWLMGFPIGWANLRDTEMPKSHCKPQQPIDSLEVCNAK